MGSEEIKWYVQRPQFDRASTEQGPAEYPGDDALAGLSGLDQQSLYDLGLRCWRHEDPELWCFPAEWYDSLPDGLEITTISGAKKTFVRGQTDNDRRYGCLAFGVLVPRRGSEG